MVRTVLKYVYLVLGTALALLFTLAAYNTASEKADYDDDGVDERSEAEVLQQEKRHHRGTARSPTDAAEHRAKQVVENPLWTILLVVAYEVLFVGVAACISFTEEIATALGSNGGGAVRVVGDLGAMVVPAWLIPLLVPIAAVAGLLFALVIHQTWKTATDIEKAALT